MTDVSSFAGQVAATASNGSSSLKFGTSGLRGLVPDLVGLPSRSYALAFIRYMLAIDGSIGEILIGRDLRSSSPAIASDCAAACKFAGVAAVDCGQLPTPALALEARRRGSPAIMVTGSHIPDDRNGLKFYRADGEITKDDEAAILAEYRQLTGLEALEASAPRFVAPDLDPLTSYVDRYVEFFGPNALGGMRVGVYQHSSVARDALVDVLEALGAEVSPFGHSPHFIPVDTEAHSPELLATVSGASKAGGYRAVVSTDGDADRPLVADEVGSILRGDVLGLITASFLKADSIVTPVTSGSVIERSNVARRIMRTRVGSPYVIEGMNEVAGSGGLVLGFEANGGVLLGGDATRESRILTALPTRDAFLPVIATLTLAAESGRSISNIVTDLDVGFAVADRLKDVPGEMSASFLGRLASDMPFRDSFFAAVGSVADASFIDGMRFAFADGSTLHYRASGNAPELRCYVEAMDQKRAENLLAWGLHAASMQLQSE